MGRESERFDDGIRTRGGRGTTFLAGLLILMGGLPQPCSGQCSEEPSVFMDERTAATHLLSKTDPELPVRVPRLARIRRVTVLVTVDRKGVICEAKGVAGARELRATAARVVKTHWRYRRFLVDWKPVVAQFPVSVRFVLPKPESRMADSRAVPRGTGAQGQAI
jgi:hypothetical protein